MRLVIACRAIDNMAGGVVERQAIALANEMARRGHTVLLLTLDMPDAQAFYQIDRTIEWYRFGFSNAGQKAGWGLRLRRMINIRALMKAVKPEAILAFQDGMFTTLLAYTLGMRIPLIASERETPCRYDFVKYATPPKWVVFNLYRFARSVTTQCPSYLKAYPESIANKITVVPNAGLSGFVIRATAR